jgi:hypothetical protein
MHTASSQKTESLHINKVFTLLIILGSLPIALLLLLSPRIELINDLGRNTIKQLFWINPKQTPRQVERLKDSPRFVGRLRDECLFKLLQELEGELVFGAEGFLTDDGLHGCCVTTNGVFGVQLIGYIAVVDAGTLCANGRLHETGQGGKYVDGWVDAFVVQLAIDENLALGDVACQVGNRMGDVCILLGR